MISFQDFKKSLGSVTLRMTDEQIEQLRQSQDKLAEAIFEIWMRKRVSNKALNALETTLKYDKI